MTCWPTRTVSESPILATRMAVGTRSSCRREISAAASDEMIFALTTSPATPSTVISSMPLTTWAAVITLPLLEIRTPEPVSLKRVTPPALTSRPLLRTTMTDGLTLRKISSRFWAPAAGTKAGSTIAASITVRTFFMAPRGFSSIVLCLPQRGTVSESPFGRYGTKVLDLDPRLLATQHRQRLFAEQTPRGQASDGERDRGGNGQAERQRQWGDHPGRIEHKPEHRPGQYHCEQTSPDAGGQTKAGVLDGEDSGHRASRGAERPQDHRLAQALIAARAEGARHHDEPG